MHGNARKRTGNAREEAVDQPLIDIREKATQIVLEQAEALSEGWAAA